MLINADFARRAIVHPWEYEWAASPQPGVERLMLDRIGEEDARATSIVRYAPGSSFPSHRHPGGEEILVLAGTFSADGEDYPAGWYLRNPPGSSHRPSSRPGATLFVKLRQMSHAEHRPVRIDTRAATSWVRRGRHVCPLFADESEAVRLQRLDPGEVLFTAAIAGAEMLVLAGDLVAETQTYELGSWIRLPEGDYPEFSAGPKGTTVYLRTTNPVDPGNAAQS